MNTDFDILKTKPRNPGIFPNIRDISRAKIKPGSQELNPCTEVFQILYKACTEKNGYHFEAEFSIIYLLIEYQNLRYQTFICTIGSIFQQRKMDSKLSFNKKRVTRKTRETAAFSSVSLVLRECRLRGAFSGG